MKPKSPTSKNGYKQIVEEIKNLNWEKLNGEELQQLMYLSYVSAREFAQALRIALKLHPDSANLQEMATGELQANNLHFEDYDKTGDHAAFLSHFLSKYNIQPGHDLKERAKIYQQTCHKFHDAMRAMTIFSREEELSEIFEKILKAKDWSHPGLEAFRYYLTRHIALDSEEGGHHDLTREFSVDESVAPFYKARLEMYRAIPKLLEE